MPKQRGIRNVTFLRISFKRCLRNIRILRRTHSITSLMTTYHLKKKLLRGGGGGVARKLVNVLRQQTRLRQQARKHGLHTAPQAALSRLLRLRCLVWGVGGLNILIVGWRGRPVLYDCGEPLDAPCPSR